MGGPPPSSCIHPYKKHLLPAAVASTGTDADRSEPQHNVAHIQHRDPTHTINGCNASPKGNIHSFEGQTDNHKKKSQQMKPGVLVYRCNT